MLQRVFPRRYLQIACPHTQDQGLLNSWQRNLHLFGKQAFGVACAVWAFMVGMLMCCQTLIQPELGCTPHLKHMKK